MQRNLEADRIQTARDEAIQELAKMPGFEDIDKMFVVSDEKNPTIVFTTGRSFPTRPSTRSLRPIRILTTS
jgi:hypothetical protein